MSEFLKIGHYFDPKRTGSSEYLIVFFIHRETAYGETWVENINKGSVPESQYLAHHDIIIRCKHFRLNGKVYGDIKLVYNTHEYIPCAFDYAAGCWNILPNTSLYFCKGGYYTPSLPGDNVNTETTKGIANQKIHSMSDNKDRKKVRFCEVTVNSRCFRFGLELVKVVDILPALKDGDSSQEDPKSV